MFNDFLELDLQKIFYNDEINANIKTINDLLLNRYNKHLPLRINSKDIYEKSIMDNWWSEKFMEAEAELE